MTMVVDFADGFTSSANPSLLGLGNEIYDILNNQSVAIEFPGLELSDYTSVFASLEVERYNNTYAYRQTIPVIIRYDDNTGLYNITYGAFDGDDLIQDVLSLPSHITLSIDVDGQIFYTSGNMPELGYVGKLKMNLTRLNA